MNHMSTTRKFGVFALLLAPLLTAAVDASANKAVNYNINKPGIACRSSPVANLGASWSSLGNWTGSTQTVWCPLDTNQSVMSASVVVSPNWISTSSCYAAFMQTATSGNWYNPTSVFHGPPVGQNYDTLSFDFTGKPEAWAGEIQCDVPNNQLVVAYSEEISIIYDWSNF
jgi:hypothetical protein